MSAQASVVAPPTGPHTRQNKQVLDLPHQRNAALRIGVVWDSKRDEHTTALIAQTVGTERIPGCTSCMQGLGPFSSCVTVTGFFNGTCANCVHSGRRKRCTLRNVPVVGLLAPVGVNSPVVPGSTAGVSARPTVPALSRASAPSLAEPFEYLPRYPTTLARQNGFEYPDSDHYSHGIGPYTPFWLTASHQAQADDGEEFEEEGDDIEEQEELRKGKKMRTK